VDPNVYLPPGFQNLFELSYFTSAKELVPVGWGSVDEDKDYPKLSSRDLQALHSMQEDDQPQDDYEMPNGRTQSEASSDVEEDDAPQLIGPTRMNEESSDEDEPAAPAPNISRVRILFLTSCISHCSVAFVSVLIYSISP
jgi:ubiquitin carboxyl-terminal hydrolase 4/11